MPSLQYWIFKKGYAQGVAWSILACFVSASNDAIMKGVGQHLHSLEVSFFRSFFALLTIMPLMLYVGKKAFKVKQLELHALRATLGVASIACWCYAVTYLPITSVTAVAFTVPMFVLILAAVFLHESVHRNIWIATCFGFVGILITIRSPESQGFSFQFSIYSGVLVLAALLFAMQDILIKKMVDEENALSMMFYFALGTTVLGAVPLYMVWKVPNSTEIMLFLVLGAGGNFIQYCLIRAFSAAKLSDLVPYRYTELIFSMTYGVMFFGEIPHIHTLIGAGVIIPSTLYIAYAEFTHHKVLAPKDV